MLAVARHGMPAVKRAVASGQYDFPQGLFYGGSQPSQLTATLSANVAAWLRDSRRAVHIDLHTGLGPRATYKLLVEQPLTTHARQQLSSSFGAGSFEAPDEHGIAYAARGTLGRWCVSRLPAVDYLYVVAEFGTYSPVAIVEGLRRENQAHHWCAPGSGQLEAARRRLVELFCPASTSWRRQVLDRSCRLIQGAIAMLQDDGILASSWSRVTSAKSERAIERCAAPIRSGRRICLKRRKSKSEAGVRPPAGGPTGERAYVARHHHALRFGLVLSEYRVATRVTPRDSSSSGSHRVAGVVGLPVSHVTRRTGRPLTLVLTETEALFKREATARDAALADLEWLAATVPALAGE